MASKKLIEMVCTGNHGRSPVAELVARNHLEHLGVLDAYDSISSGTAIRTFYSGEGLPLDDMLRIVTLGLKRDDVFDGIQRQRAGRLFLEDEFDSVSEKYDWASGLFKIAFNRFEREEGQYRTEALRAFGIKGDVKQTQDQTAVRPDVVVIFPMEKKHSDAVKRIYAQSDSKPTVETLAGYAVGEPDLGIGNAFGKDKGAYMDVIAKVIEYTPRTIDRLLREGR